MTTITIKTVINTLIKNLDYANKQKWVNKPYSWALYQTWKAVNMYEHPKEREEQ